MKWEYMRFPSNEEEYDQLKEKRFEDIFNPLGQQGWEVIYVQKVFEDMHFYLLKRLITAS